ncbi:MAG: hypothetical protein R2748_33775 [Bryobacterales bacterium]
MDVIFLCGVLIDSFRSWAVFSSRAVAGWPARFAPNSLLAPPQGDGMVHLDLDEPGR